MSAKLFSLLLLRFSLLVLCTTFANDVLAQDETLAAKQLDKSFRQYDLIKLTPNKLLAEIAKNGKYHFAAPQGDIEVSLEQRDLRSPLYRAVETVGENVRQSIAFEPIKTYKGKIVGDASSEVRLSINSEKIEGYLFGTSGKLYLEPAQRFASAAAKDDFVLYAEEDILRNQPFSCDGHLHDRIEQAANRYVSPENRFAASTVRVFEIATEADHEYVLNFGNSVNANNEILSILNMIEGAFEQEFGIVIDVTFQHTWATPDSYPQGSTNALLNSFQNYWNANFPNTQYPRDAAHLFSAKSNVMYQGIAYMGVTCSNPAAAYSLTGLVGFAPGKFTVPAHELAHNLNANHVDGSQSCANTVMNPFLNNDIPLSFCQFSRNEITTFVNNSGSCLSTRSTARTKFDYDGDGKSDFTVFRAANGTWYTVGSGSGNFAAVQFGQNGDLAAPEDYDGDRKTDFAVFRSGVWYVLRSTNSTFSAIGFGVSGDKPAPADFTGDGQAELAVFRPSNGTWYTLNLVNNNVSGAQFGIAEDVPVAADYDADGRADFAVFRPSNNVWYQQRSTAGFTASFFGSMGDRPAPADYDGDGRTDVAVFRPMAMMFYVRPATSGNSFYSVQFGLPTDVPVPADYDGDGKADIAVWRPMNGVWYRMNSSNNAFGATQFGQNGDSPAPAAYVPQ